MEIRELAPKDFDNVVEVFGQKIIKFEMLKFEDKNCNLGAFDNGRLIGLITAQPRKLIKPLDDQTDLFIAYIEVLEQYQNQGIATKLIKLTEDFGKQNGFFQITAWSNQNAVAMTRLVLKLKYVMCQALMYDENYLPQSLGEYIKGYYYGKRLD